MPELNSVVRLAVFELVVLNQQAQSKEKKDRKYIKGSNFRIPHKSFTCHWIRIASIVLCLDLQSLPTHVSEADQSCGVFWSLAHKRYVDDNLLQLLILKLFVGSFTKCSDLKLAAITNYGAWRCFLTKFTFGSPVSILFSKLNNSQLVRNCVALTHRNFDGYF